VVFSVADRPHQASGILARHFGLLAVCGLLGKLLTEIAFFNTAGRIWNGSELAVALSLPFVFAVLILVWPFIAITVKRLHDRNLSGWWMLLILAIPFAAKLIGLNPSTLLLIGYAMLSAMSGTSGDNRFGIDPLALGRPQARS
jgi:uncharacterized membrane protein YhaH (DUF805 family)